MTVEERFEKIEAGIRDLIVVSRTVLNSIEQLGGSVDVMRGSVDVMRDSVDVMRDSVDVMRGSMDVMRGSIEELGEAQQHTDEMFNALIQAQMESEQKVSRLADLVDKIIRSLGPNGQSSE